MQTLIERPHSLRFNEVFPTQQKPYRPEHRRSNPARKRGQEVSEPMTGTGTATSGMVHARAPRNRITLGGESIKRKDTTCQK